MALGDRTEPKTDLQLVTSGAYSLTRHIGVIQYGSKSLIFRGTVSLGRMMAPYEVPAVVACTYFRSVVRISRPGQSSVPFGAGELVPNLSESD